MMRIKTIKKKIEYWENALQEFQDTCAHENVDKVYKSNSGNCGYTSDYYWINFHCHDCDKLWREDQ